jgi:hypothetical protein
VIGDTKGSSRIPEAEDWGERGRDGREESERACSGTRNWRAGEGSDMVLVEMCAF